MAEQLDDDVVFGLFMIWGDTPHTRQDVSEALGVPVDAVFDRKREQRGRGKLAHPLLEHLPVRQGHNGGRRVGATFATMPTPAEIAARAAEIRSQRPTSRG